MCLILLLCQQFMPIHEWRCEDIVSWISLKNGLNVVLWGFLLTLKFKNNWSLEARVALGCASSNSYASFVLSKLPVCIPAYLDIRTLSMSTHFESRAPSFPFTSTEKCDSMVKLWAELFTSTGTDFYRTIRFNASMDKEYANIDLHVVTRSL